MKISLRVFGFATLIAVGVSLAANAQDATLKNISELKFGPVPNAPKCFTMAPVEGDPGKGPSTFILRGTAGCDAPMHYHTPTEKVVLVSGTAYLQMKGDAKASLMRTGGYAVAPSKHPHHMTCTAACQLYLFSDGPFDVHWVNADGKEISLAEAEKSSKKLGAGKKSGKMTSAGY
jgi:quercetin dioxygenase-like cupin family protein